MCTSVKMASPSKLEFSVRMTCQDCADAITKVLTGVEGIQSFGVDLGVERVVITTTLPSQTVLDLLESTGRPAVLQGMGGKKADHLGAAVVMMSGDSTLGVVRMVQVSQEDLIIEGTIDGLKLTTSYALNIHEYGDISQGCDSCGDILEVASTGNRKKYGEVAEFTSDNEGRSIFRTEVQIVKVWDVIGRSMVLRDVSETPGSSVACGIIARSSGLFENAKRICACDGVTLWDERYVPVAGEGRRRKIPDAGVPASQL